MGYKNAEDILPKELIVEIQEYICGECLYIPTKQIERKSWGENTGYRKELLRRNQEIFTSYTEGVKIRELANRFFLSEQSIYRIIGQVKHKVI